MRIVVVGSGGREHALAWHLSRGGHEVWAIPGNGGYRPPLHRVAHIKDYHPEKILEFLKENPPDLVAIGPEAPLAEGIADLLRGSGFKVFGPGRSGALLEASKSFAKEFMQRHGIPTAPFTIASSPEEALTFLSRRSIYPVVLKANGLRGGKGVVVARDFHEAERAVLRLQGSEKDGKREPLIIEEYLAGEEVSFHALFDGSGFIPLLPSQDYKRAYDFDKGPNTGGMGAYAPVSLVNSELNTKILERIVRPTWEGLKSEGIAYQGVLYFGLMIVQGDPYVLEYNVRFGDPECQVILALWQRDDLADYLLHCCDDRLSTLPPPEWRPGYAVCIVMASGGYPGATLGKMELHLPEELPPSVLLHPAGVEGEDSRLYTTGGRVLHVVAQSLTLEAACNKAYGVVEQCAWYGCNYRRDIGLREIARAMGESI